MNIIEAKRDRFCNYCKMSEYRENYDGRRFFTIRNSIPDVMTSIIAVCECCAKDLRDDLITLFEGDE